MPRPMGKRRLKMSGPENDATSSWGRKYICVMYRAGVKASIKRGYRRRERMTARQEIRNGRGDAARAD